MTEYIYNKKIIYNVDILHYKNIDSTNRVAGVLPSATHLMTVVSDSQTTGRGRMNRQFFSYEGGLYMSVILDSKKIKCGLGLCTSAAALAVKDTLEKNGVRNLQIKWVNDILLNRKKVCGILTEAKTVNGEINRVIVGIGINLNKPQNNFPEEIKEKAEYIGFKGDKLTLAAEIAGNLGKYIELNKSEISSRYADNMAFVGERMTVTDYSKNNTKLTGKIVGIDNDCFLSLQLDNGQIITLSSGEII